MGKGVPWHDGFPTVRVLKSDTAKRVTMVLPYYENPNFLRHQMQGWLDYAPDLRAQLTLNLVDDGSPQHPAVKAIAGVPRPFPIQIFRIGVDVRWNWLAARNVGFHHAPEGWVLVTDMDHVIPPQTMRSVIYGRHDSNVIYGFSREEYKGGRIPAHPNSWLMTREMFWKVGGYDETLSGHYGTDGDWRRRCAAVAPIQILNDVLIRHENRGDSSTTRYLRKQPEDAAVKKLVAARGPNWRPKVLSFPYEVVRA